MLACALLGGISWPDWFSEDATFFGFLLIKFLNFVERLGWLEYLGSFVFILVSLVLAESSGGTIGSLGLGDVCSCPDS